MDNQFTEKTKRRAFAVSWIKKAQHFFKETDEHVYATAISSWQLGRCNSLEHEV